MAAPLSFCQQTAVVPVLAFNDERRGVEAAAALVGGGLPVLEITFRTPRAAAVMRAVCEALPQAIVAAGSVRTPEQLRQAKDAGARFAVSPGATDSLLAAADLLPLLPGAATASEVMCLSERGYAFVKFFPAASSGGVAALKALHGPLPEVRFCPTGGINPDNVADYLALPNVVCVGGSWLVKDGDAPAAITEKARACAALRPSS